MSYYTVTTTLPNCWFDSMYLAPDGLARRDAYLLSDLDLGYARTDRFHNACGIYADA